MKYVYQLRLRCLSRDFEVISRKEALTWIVAQTVGGTYPESRIRRAQNETKRTGKFAQVRGTDIWVNVVKL